MAHCSEIPEPSGLALHGVVNGLNSGRKHGQWSVRPCATLTSCRRAILYLYVSWSGNIRHRCGGSKTGHILFLAGPFQEGGCDVGDESAESRSVLQPLRIPSVIRPARRISVVVVR